MKRPAKDATINVRVTHDTALKLAKLAGRIYRKPSELARAAIVNFAALDTSSAEAAVRAARDKEDAR